MFIWRWSAILSLTVITGCGVPEGGAVAERSPTEATPILAETEVATETPPLDPYPLPTVTPEPTSVPVVDIPACSFPLAFSTPALTPLAESLDQLRFSEPKVILTGESFQLADWLPNEQKVLISQRVNQLDQIAVLDLATQTTQEVATRVNIGARPFWVDQTGEAVFSDNEPDGTKVVRKGKPGAPAAMQTLGQLVIPYIAATADGSTMLAFVEPEGANPAIWQMQSGDAKQSVAVRQFSFQPAPAVAAPGMPYRAAWLPDNQHVAIYGGGRLHLVDNVNGTACQIDVGLSPELLPLWVYDVSFSSNGKWAALVLAQGKAMPNYSAYYMLDMETGEVKLLDIEGLDIVEIAWSPDGRYLIASGVIEKNTSTRVPILTLFLYDTASEKSQRLFASFSSDLGGGYGFEASGLLWSPDGKTILAQCTAGSEDRLCQIEVTLQ
jgi:dipeptidyl aminopeptidase/acylaminoacyl peptidase